MPTTDQRYCPPQLYGIQIFKLLKCTNYLRRSVAIETVGLSGEVWEAPTIETPITESVNIDKIRIIWNNSNISKAGAVI